MILFKMQLACLAILYFIASNYLFEKYHNKVSKRKFDPFDDLKTRQFNFAHLLCLGICYIIFDILSVYTVNHLESIPAVYNTIIHGIFLLSLDAVLYFTFIYITKITGFYPTDKKTKFLIWLPFYLGSIAIIVLLPKLHYNIGKVTNYSMGGSVYVAFGIAILCILGSIIVFAARMRYIDVHKRVLVRMFLIIVLVCLTIQAIYPESLISGMGVTLIILAVYLNEDNPTMKKLAEFHNEMTNSFANMVENRDENTGGHIRRVTAYVAILSNELRNQKKYSKILTSDWIRNLAKSAPLHDVGKISIPDSILLKPGKLTEEEYERMKTHTTKGAEIIEKSFGHLDDPSYYDMVYQVAKYHHEKWNGKGYPCGLAGEDIPLSARIMALADVFDAISQKRCYREAMPLEKCFEIIESGKGTDFDPDLTESFLSLRPTIERICLEFREE